MRRDWLGFSNRAPALARAFFVLVGPLALFFAILTSVGPYLQYFSYWALEGDQALTFDEAMHGGGTTYLPSLANWTTAFLDWRFLMIGLGTAIFATRAKMPRQIVVLGAVSLVPLLCVIDLFDLITSGRLALEAIVRSLLANVVGAALAGVASAIALWCFERILRGLPNLRFGRILASASIPLNAVFWSVAVYYLLTFFLQPTDEEFELVLQSPIRGFVVPHEENKKVSAEDEHRAVKSFSLVPNEAVDGSASVIAADGSIHGNWRALTSGLPFKAEIFLLADCPDFSHAKNQTKVAEFTSNGVSQLGFVTSSADAELEIGGGKARAFTLTKGQSTMFWLTPDKAKQHAKITHFAGPKNLLGLKSNGKLETFIQFPLINSDHTKIKRVGGYVDISINGKRSRFNYAAPNSFDLKQIVRCRSVTVTSSKESIPASERILIGGVFIRLTPMESVELVYSPYDQEMSIAASKGWASVDGIPSSSLQGDIGATDSLSIAGNGGQLTFAGRTIALNEESSFSVMGHVRASLTEKMEGRFSGQARFFWMDDHLLNRTQWKRLSIEWQVIALGWLGSMVLFLLRLLRPVLVRFRENAPLLV